MGSRQDRLARTEANARSVPFARSAALSTSSLQPPGPTTPDPAAATSPTSPTDIPERLDTVDYLPGDPSINLSPAVVWKYLHQELSTPVLDDLYDRLWLVAREGGQNIDCLNRQRVKGRTIIPTDDVHLHLVWHADKIYLKPVPACLLNHDFWSMFLPHPNDHPPQRLFPSASYRPAALGFMRTYALLIRSQLDFRLAREAYLLPDDVTWPQWSRFIVSFRGIEEAEVGHRYHYGQLRLSRLNWIVRLFQPPSAPSGWFYQIPHWSVATYVERAIAPLLFVFISLSLVFSGMQVMIGIPMENLGLESVGASAVSNIQQIFWSFSVAVLVLLAVIWSLLVVIPCGGLIWQLQWGIRHRERPAQPNISKA